MTDLPGVRRVLLRAFMQRHRLSQAELARRIGKSPSQTADMLAGRKAFGEKVARAVEAKLEMRRGALDDVDAVLRHPDGTMTLVEVKQPASARSAATRGHPVSPAVGKTTDERLPARPPRVLEQAQVIDGVELTRDAIEVAAAYMQLSGRQRQAVKLMVETLGMVDSAIVPDARLEHLRAPTEKTKKEKA